MDQSSDNTLIQQFRQWVLTQTSSHYKLYINAKDENVIVIETSYCRGEVTFFPMDIIQLSVLNLVTDRHEFYLHFQMHTLEHAMKLFREMLESVKELAVKPPVRILLSCTSGLTTGFFAQKLNESAQLLSLNYEFTAVSYGNLYHVASQYDIILLAPQISYIYETAKKILHNKKVCQIPPKVFATYDVKAVFTDLEPLLSPSKHTGRPYIRQLPLKKQVKSHVKILTIALIREDDHYLLSSRIYTENNGIIFDEVSIKPQISVDDICDVCDTAFAIYPEITTVGLSMPGIIDEGRVTLPKQGFDESNILESLSKRYSRKFVLDNDANCIAVGYYASQDQYRSISALFQPFVASTGGLGSIHNGQLIEGYRHVAGEVQFLPLNSESDSDNLAPSLRMTPEGTLSWAAQTIASIISILGPELILLSCRLIVQIDGLIKELEKYVPGKYIPEIIQIDSVKEYMLLGLMILCTEAIEENQRVEGGPSPCSPCRGGAASAAIFLSVPCT